MTSRFARQVERYLHLNQGRQTPADSVFLFSYFVRNGEDGLKCTALRAPRAVVKTLK
ncbi:MAG TPA: hypothetical protein VKC51_02625 [Lacunisphaera sp.]|nr:hypothetical protein [Lacunisphaera sp.]